VPALFEDEAARGLPANPEELPVKVIGAGYTRTGTVSLAAALELLGVGPCLHPRTAAQTDEVLLRARSGESVTALNWSEGLARWNAALGWVGARHYRELIDVWPSSLVLLSVREPEAWYESYAACLRATRELAMAGGPQLAAAEDVALDVLMMPDRPLWKDILDGSFERRDEALARYQRHNDEVSRTVPPERLLVFDVEDGWEPLCAFLGVAVPDLPFPHLNDCAELRARLGPGVRRHGDSPLVHPATPHISRLTHADPARSFSQQEVLDALGMAEDPFAQRIFASCGVTRRHLTALEDQGGQTLQGRTAASEAQLFELAVSAVDQLGVDPRELDVVVSASLYSLGGPTIAHRLVEHYEMDPATDKYHVVGIGCASAVPLVRLVARTLPEHEGSRGLIVAAESMSGLLSQAAPDDPRAKVIGSAIFGDGCSAAIVEQGEQAAGPAVVASTVHQLAGTLEIVHMALADDDSHLHLARELPDLASAGLDRLVDDFLAPLGLTRYAIDHWMIHPGGRRILRCVQGVLGLPDDEVAISYEVLADHGNIGTPSIFYVLEETMRRRSPAAGDRGLMITIGPGITLGLMLLVF
jgi:predicted naringenin-chalcone synthase